MEEQVVRLLKSFATQFFSDETSIEVIVEQALNDAEVVLSPASKEELIRHIQLKIFEMTELPN